MKRVNSPSFDSTSIFPSCFSSIMDRVIDSPKPVPSPTGFVVKNAENICSRIFSGIPIPLSSKTNSKTIRRPSPTSTYWKSGSPRTPTDSTYTITCTSCTCVTEMSSPQGYTGIRFVLYSPKAPMRKLWAIRIIWIICDA